MGAWNRKQIANGERGGHNSDALHPLADCEDLPVPVASVGPRFNLALSIHAQQQYLVFKQGDVSSPRRQVQATAMRAPHLPVGSTAVLTPRTPTYHFSCAAFDIEAPAGKSGLTMPAS
jgi:hypothetical protein